MDVIRRSVTLAGTRVHHDLQRLDFVMDAVEFRLDIGG
jgi:hypothetical protein